MENGQGTAEQKLALSSKQRKYKESPRKMVYSLDLMQSDGDGGQSSSDGAVYDVCEEHTPAATRPPRQETGMILNPVYVHGGEDDEEGSGSSAWATTKRNGTSPSSSASLPPFPSSKAEERTSFRMSSTFSRVQWALLALVALIAVAALALCDGKASRADVEALYGMVDGSAVAELRTQAAGLSQSLDASEARVVDLEARLAEADTHTQELTTQMAQLTSALDVVEQSAETATAQAAKAIKDAILAAADAEAARAAMVSLVAAIEAMEVTLPTTLASRVAGLELLYANQVEDAGLLWTVDSGKAGTKRIVETCPSVAALRVSKTLLESSVAQGKRLGIISPVGAVVQFGSPSNDVGRGIAVSGGGVFVTGYTNGDMYGSSAGSNDVFVVRYNLNGTEVWGMQFGSSSHDYGYGIAVSDDGAFVTGDTKGDMFGNSTGSDDVFLARYNLNGTKVSGVQFGGSSSDYGAPIALSGDSVFVTGQTGGVMYGSSAGSEDTFVARYNLNGTEMWGKQFGSSSSDFGHGIAASGDGVFVTGYTGGEMYGSSAGNEDVFVARYNLNGTEAWGRQFGSSSSDYGRGIAVSDDGVFVTGYTNGDMFGSNAGFSDVFVARYNLDGTQAWGRRFGTSSDDVGYGIAVSGDGIFVTGYTGGDMYGSSAGSNDIFVARYNLDGTEAWTVQFGTSSHDAGYGIAASGDGVFVTGKISDDAFISFLSANTSCPSSPR